MTGGISNRYPKLRWPIDIRLQTIESQEILILTCPLGISPTPLLLTAAVGPIIACFEGSMTIDDIQRKFSQYNVSRQLIEELIRILDENLFLANDKFFTAEKGAKESFILSDVREASLAGLGYPAKKEDLQRELNNYLNLTTTGRITGRVVGLIAPHIDYKRGGKAYGSTYKYLQNTKTDLFLLFGTAHQFSRGLFHLTRKDFATPFGILKNERVIIDNLVDQLGNSDNLKDEFLHKREHSIELQLPFLAHVVPNPSILPVLVGSFHSFIAEDKLPNEFDAYENFVSNLASILRKKVDQGESVCIIAGADMAHIGKNFGDKGNLNESVLKETYSKDSEYLKLVSEQDKNGLFDHMRKDLDSRRICGFPSVYTTLDLIERIYGKATFKLALYDQAVDLSNDCCVTYAGGAFYI